MNDEVTRLRLGFLLLTLVTVFVIGMVYDRCIDNRAAGFLHDDGVYAITGKALAEGDGPRLSHRATQPIQVRYPILYPLLLSIGWSIDGDFPQNLSLLTWLTTAFSLAFLVLFYLYLCDVKKAHPVVAWLVVVLTATSYQFVVYSTMLMSELPFLFLALVAIYHAERFLIPKARWKTLMVAVLLATLAFHARTVGVIVIAAVFLQLVLAGRHRQAWVYGFATAALTVLPWMMWVAAFAPEMKDAVDYPYIHPYGNYGFDLAARFNEHEYSIWLAMSRGFDTFVGDVLESMFPLFENLLQIVPSAGLGADSSFVWGYVVFVYFFKYLFLGFFLLQLGKAVTRRQFSVAGIYSVLYCLLIVFWNYENSMPRFLVVVLPWFWFYLLKPGFGSWGRMTKRPKPWLRSAFLLGVVALTLWPSFLGIRFIRDARIHHAVADLRIKESMWKEYQDAFRFVRNELPEDAAIATESDPVFHLYTNRKTFYMHYDGLRIIDGQFTDQSYTELMAALDRYNVRYVAVEPEDVAVSGQAIPNQVAMRLIASQPSRFKHLYATPAGHIRFYELLPRPSDFVPNRSRDDMIGAPRGVEGK